MALLSNSDSLFDVLFCRSDAPRAARSRTLRVSDETKMLLSLTEYIWNDHISLVAGGEKKGCADILTNIFPASGGYESAGECVCFLAQ